MRKALALLGLVLTTLGVAGQAMAQSGSDSSGTHSYSLECNGEDLVFSNTGAGRIRLLFQLAMGSGGATLNAGESENLGTPGIDTGPPGTHFEVWFEDPAGSNDFYGMDQGNFPDCAEAEVTYSATASIVCAGPGVQVTNTGTGDLVAYGATIGTRTELPAGASHTFAWGTGGPSNDLLDPTGWDVYREDGNSEVAVDGGTFTLAQMEAACAATPDVAPELINECRGADWYLVNPDVDGEDYTFAYRLGAPLGVVLYDPDYTSNNPDAVYGEILVPAGTNEVGYADDFNATHTAVRPAECGGPATPTTTAPPTTAAPTEPSTPQAPAAVLAAIVAEGFVAPGARGRPWVGDLRCDRLRPRRAGRRDAVLDSSRVGHRDGRRQRQRQHHV